MTLVKFGEDTTISLWEYKYTDWEGDTYACPKCGYEIIQNEGTTPFYNYCPVCGKKMFTDKNKEIERKAKKKEYMRKYNQKRRIKNEADN